MLFTILAANTVGTDWTALGGNLFIMFVAILTAWNTWRQQRTAKTVQETAVNVERVHKLTNSNMGDTLLISYTSALALAAQKNTPENAELARLARVKYEDHMSKQAHVDAGNHKTT